MPIHTQDYRHWEGTLKPHSPMRWWVITKAELKLLAQRKLVRLIVAIPPAIYVLAHAMLIYLSDYLPEDAIPFLIDKAFFHRFFFSFRFVFLSGFLIALVTIFSGSGLIATDLKNNALSLYLSKPISWVDYLIGKFAVVGTLLGCTLLIPGLLLFLEHALLTDTNFFQKHYWMPLSMIAYSAIIITSTSLLMLLFSSLTSNPRYATIGFCAVWFGSNAVFGVLREITRSGKTALVSIWANYDRLGTALFGLPYNYAVHWFWALLVVTVLAALCILVLRHRIRAVEIVK